MNWLTNFVKPKLNAIKSKLIKKDNLWTKCNNCQQMIFTKELKENLFVCDNCNFHLNMPVTDRLDSIYDDKKYEEVVVEKVIDDPLKFKDKIKYIDRLNKVRKQLNTNDSIKVVKGKIDSFKLVTAIMDFKFMGGSMGMQVGEGIVKAAEEAKKIKCPLLIIASSGGARMQEGILALMQMPRTIAAIENFKELNLPYIVLFTNPTTGGVSASFTMIGDILLAEPGALIGFAGPRVIKKTVNQDLPENFQKSEFLLEHGMIDLIIERENFKNKLTLLLKHLIKN
ncbi:MAG: Acetyl-coenzyme A carboxylase carboxyl transferase subunit beta [Alphaproteobacteria bacterium MarineAlpha9_Bin4]|nr:acetyl-CoA carboxylase carboxyl transferase subunit beta [Pelagibacterales bacterium]PPR27330.1 MAG: Acetyl-coenzyme A carboxylase carboxyl transferase subunit beta [Alphaproteobacteria bacterium MarineAlpha9_Bin4]|tara:strand:- start:7126 stop:7974 length:849 start_codon:yes stop_codon:yes gene_type:complete